MGLIGGAAAWSGSARAHQPERLHTVGILAGLASSADNPVAVESLRPFKDEMQKAGWIEGDNIRLWRTVRPTGDVHLIQCVASRPQTCRGGLP
jgi:hypothetical protein